MIKTQSKLADYQNEILQYFNNLCLTWLEVERAVHVAMTKGD